MIEYADPFAGGGGDFAGAAFEFDCGVRIDPARAAQGEMQVDLSFGLRAGSHEMGDAQTEQGALELAFRVAAVVEGTVSEQAQPVGVDDLRQTVGWNP